MANCVLQWGHSGDYEFLFQCPQLPNQPLIGIVLSFVIYYFGAKRQQTNTESLEME